MAEEVDKKTVIGNFALNAQMPDGKSINISCYMLEGEDLESLNARLHFCQDAIDVQRARCEIKELEARREQFIKGLEQTKEVLNGLAAKQRESHLTSQEKLTLQNHSQNVVKITDEIKKGEAAIADAKRRAGMAA